MIPSDLAARLRTLAEASFFDSEPPVQGTARIREIQARLPQFLPGEKFTATLTRPLPDGTFQAIVAGRSYTLALAHTAKSGDTLELVVTRNTPNAIVAQLAPPPSATQAAAAAERPQLSATGRLISFLLTGQPAPQPAALAGGRPLLNAPPAQGGTTLAPLLRQALSHSGLFYESHQSQWLSGKSDLATLLAEPQGRHGPARTPPDARTAGGAAPAAAAQPVASGANLAAGARSASPLPNLKGDAGPMTDNRAPRADPSPVAARTVGAQAPLGPTGPGTAAGAGAAAGQAPQSSAAGSSLPSQPGMTGSPASPQPGSAPGAAPFASPPDEAIDTPPAVRESTAQTARPTTPAQASSVSASEANATRTSLPGASSPDAETSAVPSSRTPTVPERLMPIVHQQLDSLATQHYVVHAQAWPGQSFEWEIDDPEQRQHGGDDDRDQTWRTTLRLSMPRLGGVEAQLHLTPAGLAVRVQATDSHTAAELEAARDLLEAALEAADIPLTGFVAERRDVE